MLCTRNGAKCLGFIVPLENFSVINVDTGEGCKESGRFRLDSAGIPGIKKTTKIVDESYAFLMLFV